MNTRLAEFLIALVRDPERLSAFNGTESGREALLREADLPEADKTALRSEDATDVLRRLQVSEDDGLTWVIAPGIKKFTVGFTVAGGIKANTPLAALRAAMATEGAGIKAMATASAGIKDTDLQSGSFLRGLAASKKSGVGPKPTVKRARAKAPSASKSARKPRG